MVTGEQGKLLLYHWAAMLSAHNSVCYWQVEVVHSRALCCSLIDLRISEVERTRWSHSLWQNDLEEPCL